MVSFGCECWEGYPQRFLGEQSELSPCCKLCGRPWDSVSVFQVMSGHLFAVARRWVAREARTAPRLGRAGLGAACLFAGGAAGLVWAEPTTTRPRRRPIQSIKTQRGVLEDDYELGEKLGSGFYGNVYRGKCKRTGMAVAIKVLPRTGDAEADATVRREVAAMRRVALHTAITEIHEFYESSDHFYIVMEFVDGGELLDLLVDGGPFREPRAAALMKEVGGAIALLHAQGMCHSDIKPENIVLTKEGQVRLIDFGTTFAVDAKLDEQHGRNAPRSQQPVRPHIAPEAHPLARGCPPRLRGVFVPVDCRREAAAALWCLPKVTDCTSFSLSL